MKERTKNTNQNNRENKIPKEDDLQGYPPYPSSEDIYGKLQKDSKIDPEDPSGIAELHDNYKGGKFNEKDFDDDITGGDLDIPGSELDDLPELTGSEDEENNYYSLGGDDHNDLEED